VIFVKLLETSRCCPAYVTPIRVLSFRENFRLSGTPDPAPVMNRKRRLGVGGRKEVAGTDTFRELLNPLQKW